MQVCLPLKMEPAFSVMVVGHSLQITQEEGDLILIATSCASHPPPARQASPISPDIHNMADASSPLPQLCLRAVASHHALC